MESKCSAHYDLLAKLLLTRHFLHGKSDKLIPYERMHSNNIKLKNSKYYELNLMSLTSLSNIHQQQYLKVPIIIQKMNLLSKTEMHWINTAYLRLYLNLIHTSATYFPKNWISDRKKKRSHNTSTTTQDSNEKPIPTPEI